MENKMKKLIALFATTAVASTSAVAGIALSGAASVSYDDNGSTASATTYDADLSFVGTTGATTVTIGMDVDAAASISGVDMATKIGPVSIAADMFNADESNTDSGTGNYIAAHEPDDRSVTVSLDVPVGDATIGLDNSGDVVISGTFSGVTITHTMKGGTDATSGSASIAGMDITINRTSDDTTTWSVATTVSGVDLTLTDAQKITAAFGLAGNTMTVTRVPDRASKASTFTKYAITTKASYSTVAISRDLTSGATLSATYSTENDSLTLKAAVAF
jgi:hypothetical protein